jgi:hypothetical protein
VYEWVGFHDWDEYIYALSGKGISHELSVPPEMEFATEIVTLMVSTKRADTLMFIDGGRTYAAQGHDGLHKAFARTRYVTVPWVHANVGYGAYPHAGRLTTAISAMLTHAQIDAMGKMTVHTDTILSDVDTSGPPADAPAQPVEIKFDALAHSINVPQKMAGAHFRTHHYTSRYNFPTENCHSAGIGVSPWGKDMPKQCLGEATYLRSIAAQVKEELEKAGRLNYIMEPSKTDEIQWAKQTNWMGKFLREPESSNNEH